MVYELINPKLEAETENRSELERLKTTVLGYHHERLQKIEFALFKTEDKPTVFQEIFKRLIDIDVRHHEDKNTVEGKINDLKTSTDDFRFLVKTNEEKIAMIDTKIETFRGSLDEAVDNLRETKLYFTEQLSRTIQQ